MSRQTPFPTEAFFSAGRAIDQAGRLDHRRRSDPGHWRRIYPPRFRSRPLAEELRRVIPVIRHIIKEFPDMLLSIDTYKAETARQAIEAGADIINDITGLRGDPQMVK